MSRELPGGFFVNLPLRWIRKDREWLRRFIRAGLHPELGMDCMSMGQPGDDASLDWHRGVAAELAEAGLSCSIHLPFFDIQPGSLDDLALAAARERLRRAFALAEIYRPAHLVGHAAYTGLYVELYDEWLARAAESWRLARAAWPDAPPLHLENTYEKRPGPVLDLIRALQPAFGERVGVCFDAGHWFSFADGRRKNDLADWLAAFSGLPTHLHLHDNDGSADQHLGLGQGHIPLDGLLAALRQDGVPFTATLEPHSPEDLAASLQWLGREPGGEF